MSNTKLNTSLQTTLHLAKQNFKFSSAHFLIFDEKSAEMLHGHNYQVKVDLNFQQNEASQLRGYAVDFHILKAAIKVLCDDWDEHILLPEKHTDMKYVLSREGQNYDIHFRDRFYSFPVKETIWLPVTNTSVENLSAVFAKKLFQKVANLGVTSVTVNVEETRGQSASSVAGV